jgi:hypothetical protein
MSKDDLKLSNQDLLEKLNLLDGTMLKRAVESPGSPPLSHDNG